MIYAIDFDGTIVEDKYPGIGEIEINALVFINRLKQCGHRFILHTCRHGQSLREALEFLRQFDDIERIAQDRKKIILMDNNFLANDFEFVKEQLEKSVRLGLKIDFNQGLDARLITPENAALLAKQKWTSASSGGYIRFSCDTAGMIEPLRNAVQMLRKVGYKGEFFVYVLAQELNESLERIRKVLEIDHKCHPFCQPFRNLDGDGEIADKNLKRLARWCNMASIRKSCKFEDYKG